MPSAEPAAPARTTSLTTRLAVVLALLLAGGGAAVAIAAFAYGRSAAQQAYDRLLVGAASQIAGAVTLRDGDIAVDLPVAAFELLALAPDDRIVYAVFAPDGRVVTGYAGVAPPADGATFANAAIGGERYRLAAARRLFAERTFSGAVAVVVGQTTRARDELAGEITRTALAVVGVAGVLMSGLAVFAVRSALGPLRRIERALAARAPEDLTPLDVAVPREIDGLVGAMNRFMGRLDRQVGVMRTLIADASHQLRTPIAALRAQADLAAGETDPARQRAIVARIHERAVGLGRLADQLLNHALIIHRADAVPRERVDLRTVAISTAEQSDHDLVDEAPTPESILPPIPQPILPPILRPIVNLDLPEDPVWCDGDTLSLSEACKNLVANAVRYGAPPVTLAVRRVGRRAVIGVCDCGPGVPEAHWGDAGKRYARSSGVSPQSAGLGLAIVHAVASAHRGRLRFARTPAGAFEAALVLPAAGAPR